MKVTIEKLDHFGRGITRVDGKITFVDNALPDEEVDITLTKTNKKYNEAIVNKYYTKSDLRRKPRCVFYDVCGGCDLRHIHCIDTIKYKKDKLTNIFNKYTNTNPNIKVVPSINKNFYRNKIELKCLNGKYGFYKKHSHSLVEVDRCLNAEEPINKFLLNIEDLNLKNGYVTIKTNSSRELLIVIETKENVNIDIDHLISKNKIVGIILNDKTIYGTNYFMENILDMYFKESYNSFFQVNRYINGKIFEIIRENINEDDIVADLCCGVGTLSINASKNAKRVYGIEIVLNSIKDATINANLNNASNVKFMLGDAFKIVKEIKDDINTFIIDPPRSGISKDGIKAIQNILPKKIIYVSCNPITMARDINLIKDKYMIDKTYMLDNFPYTYHIEAICILKLI